MKRCVAVLFLSLLSLQMLSGWNDAGHRAIAFLAWSHMNERARARAAEILRNHPDFSTLLNPGPGLRPADVNRYAFAAAATWPDIIRGDKRFTEKASGAGPAAGFPDMGVHANWHFINTPIPAPFANRPVEPENAVTELDRLLGALQKAGPVTVQEAYALPWIIHLTGDLHQPLHTVARFSRTGGKPVHDRGGNACYVQGARNLHSLWDGLLGTSSTPGEVARLAVSLGDQFPEPVRPDTRPASWVREGVAISQKFVYSFAGRCDDRDNPAKLPPGYLAEATNVARERAALAAYRLAAILNQKLGR